MENDAKLDKIIELLAAQNKLLSSMLISLKTSSPASTKPKLDIRDEVMRKIEEAKRDATSKVFKIQNDLPEMKTNFNQ